MIIKDILFLIFAIISTVTAALVVTLKNPVSSAISMIACLFSIAMVYFVMGAHFVGTVQILVYAGAIMVLFLFVIMLLEKRDVEEIEKASPARIINLILIAAMFISIMAALAISFGGTEARPVRIAEAFGTIREVGMAVFTRYIFAFELLSVLILAAMAGVVTLSARDGDK